MSINIDGYFKRYAWACEQLEEQIWRSSFATEHEDEFDLYVMVGDDWVHFAVSPFLPRPAPEQRERLNSALLMLNQQMRLVHFAVDEEGDINLLADLPARNFVYSHFAIAMDALVYYTQTLAHELARMALDPNYRSPRIAV